MDLFALLFSTRQQPCLSLGGMILRSVSGTQPLFHSSRAYQTYPLCGFHHGVLPFVISASDDNTIRIWNFQSRSPVSVLSDHTGCVMSASFHPAHDLIVSASLDRTVRVWGFQRIWGAQGLGLSVQVTHVLRGHTAGVNSASFHPTELLVVSGGMDCSVKLWDISTANNDVAVTTFNGHKHYVSSAVFYSKGPVTRRLFVSLSQDKSIILWDAMEGKMLETFTRTDDRFWSLAVHPEMNLLAAGHDTGMFVFKLLRERPAFAVSGNSVVYAKDQGLYRSYFPLDPSKEDNNLAFATVKDITSWNPLTSLSYCPSADAVVACSDREVLLVDTQGACSLGHGEGKFSACFVTDALCAVLEIGTNILRLKNLKGSVVTVFSMPCTADAIFFAGINNVLCRSESKMFIYDLVGRLIICELETPSVVGHVVWSRDMESVALLSKYSIVIASKKLVLQHTLDEKKRVKSGAWDDENGVFIYTSLDHIKFWRPSGKSGIIKSLEVPVYAVTVSGNNIFCLDRSAVMGHLDYVPEDYFSVVSVGVIDDGVTRNNGLKEKLSNITITFVGLGEQDRTGSMDFDGKWSLIYFGCTSSEDVGAERLETMHDACVGSLRPHVVPFFLTVDPQRDTCACLREFLGDWACVIQGVTGDGTTEAAQLFGVDFNRIEGEEDDYLVETSHRMYLVNPEVEIVRSFGMEISADEMLREIATVMTFARMVPL